MIALLEAHRAGLFRRGHILNNVVAGVIVGIVALPLAMAFAIASGAKPEQGLYTAIVAGLLTTTLGGTRLQISGPTARSSPCCPGSPRNTGSPACRWRR
jgi:SulP family sulfate permease